MAELPTLRLCTRMLLRTARHMFSQFMYSLRMCNQPMFNQCMCNRRICSPHIRSHSLVTAAESVSALAEAMAVEVTTAGARFMSAAKLEDSGITIIIITNVGETRVKLGG